MTSDHGEELRRLLKLTAAARQLDPQLPTQLLHVLLAVAARPGATYAQVMAETALTHPSVSRNVVALTTVHRNGKAGLGLVAQVPDPTDCRALCLYLTGQGREAVRHLLHCATGQPADWFSPRVVR